MQNLVGLRKIECSSTKIKSKERHSSTSRACRIVLVTFGVGSPDVCRESRRSEVLTCDGSADVQSLSLCGDWGRRKSRRESGVLTARSPHPRKESRCQAHRLALLTAVSGVPMYVRSPNGQQSRHKSEVPTLSFAQCFFTLREQYFL
jgi:hypothetical protein